MKKFFTDVRCESQIEPLTRKPMEKSRLRGIASMTGIN